MPPAYADLPIVDLDDPNSRDELSRGLFETGFLLLRDHVVPRDLLDGVRRTTLEFMARPIEEKASYRGFLRGWSPYGSESGAAGYGEDSDQMDLCQKYSMGRTVTESERAEYPDYFGAPEAEVYFEPNVFPDPEMARLWQDYYARMDAICLRLLDRVREELGLGRDAWAALASHPVSVMRMLAYPEESGGLRMGAHYDDTLITVLHQSVPENGFAALEVMLPGDDTWVPVEPTDEYFVVNVGEALTFISGGRVRATRHRVVAAPDGQAEGSARTSIVHFFLPNWNARLWPAEEPGLDAQMTRFDRPEIREPDGSIIYHKALSQSLDRVGHPREPGSSD